MGSGGKRANQNGNLAELLEDLAGLIRLRQPKQGRSAQRSQSSALQQKVQLRRALRESFCRFLKPSAINKRPSSNFHASQTGPSERRSEALYVRRTTQIQGADRQGHRSFRTSAE